MGTWKVSVSMAGLWFFFTAYFQLSHSSSITHFLKNLPIFLSNTLSDFFFKRLFYF